MIYLFVLIVILVGVYRFDIQKQIDNNDKWLRFVWLLLVLVSGLRYMIGGDTYAYMEYYPTVPALQDLSKDDFLYTRYQPLFVLFTSLCRSIGDSFLVFQLLHAVVVNTAFLQFFKKNTRYVHTCILFYALFFYFNYNTEILRASLCVAIFLFSYQFLAKKKWIYYLLCVLLSFGIHAESLMLLLFPLCHFTRNNKFIYSVVVIVGAVGIFALMDVIPVISDYLSFYENVQHALDAHSNEDTFRFNANGIIKYVMTIALWGYLLWIKRNDITINRFFFYMVIVSSILIFKYNIIFARAMDFVYPLLIIEVVGAIYEKKFLIKPVFICILFYSWSQFYFWTGSGYYSYHQYFPYASYLNPYEDPIRTRVVMEYHPILSPK